MSEGMFEQSEDAAQTADACSTEADFLAHVPTSLYPLEAANDNHRSRPYIPFSPGWYVMCLGDHDLG
jgi:hypothetical protein